MTFHIEEIKLSDWELQSWLATEGTVFLDTASAVYSFGVIIDSPITGS